MENEMDTDHTLFFRFIRSVFEKCKLGYFVFQTAAGGYVAMIPVGLETIGSVVFENQQGQQIGVFDRGPK